MKNLFYIINSILICFATLTVAAQSEVVLNHETGEPINLVDENNLKQGFWKVSAVGSMRKSKTHQPQQVIEQGYYKNNKKQGLWTTFFPSGEVKSELEYENGRLHGTYKIYHENGQVQEEGVWKNNRNISEFKRYYENGQVSQQFVFNTSGKRNGQQVYFYENGQVMMETNVEGGKEKVVKEFYEDGSLKASKKFVNGAIDESNTQFYQPSKIIKDRDAEELKKVHAETVTVDTTEIVNSGVFRGDGHHKMYNSNKQLSKSGFFKSYRLMDGKSYIYNANGILIQIKQFKNGRYIGDAPLSKD